MGGAPFCFVSPAQWDSTWAHSRKDGSYTLDAFGLSGCLLNVLLLVRRDYGVGS